MTKRRRISVNLEAEVAQVIARKNAVDLGELGIYPLNAPMLPPPGPDFMAHARSLGDLSSFVTESVVIDGKKKRIDVLDTPGYRLVDLHRRALRDPDFSMPIQIRPGFSKETPMIPGHIWGENAAAFESGNKISVTGPQKAEVMVIGKMPNMTEINEGRCLVGEGGKLLIEILRELHVKNTSKWYVTNLIKFNSPDGSGSIKSAWLKDCLPLLHQELRIVQPKYILCIGSDASKALLGSKFGVDAMDGRVMEIEFPLNTKPWATEEEKIMHKALVMTVLAPGAVIRAPDQRRRLERGIARFDMLQRGIRFDIAETDIDHRTIRTLEQLQALLHEIKHDPLKTDNWVSFDAEWHGEHPQNKGSYVRLMQFAWRPKCAAAIVWNDVNGNCAFFDEENNPAQAQAIVLLNDFFKDKRIAMHFGVADLEWMEYIGLTMLAKRYQVPLFDKAFDKFTEQQQAFFAQYGYKSGDDIPAFMRTHFEGSMDTGLAAHAIEETAQLGLEVLAMRMTTVPRYDIGLQTWKEDYCRERKIKAKDLEGYGMIPDEVIIPYSIYDADTTLRLAYEYMPLLDCDYEGNNCRESFWESMLTVSPILEMHCTGIPVDIKRIDQLTFSFMKAKAAQEEKIKTWAKWPDFNIRSVMQVREFLFGEKYNGKKTEDNQIIRLRPAGAKTLALEPILNTGKPPKQWKDIKERGLEAENTPGTAKQILGILAQDNPDHSTYINWLRDHRFLDQVLKSVLRPPRVNKEGETIFEESDDFSSTDAATGQEASPFAVGTDNMGSVIYDAGLASVICDDGRVRTHLYPTTETKRWRSSRPNLQNCSKRRDPDYARLLGGHQDENKNWVGGDYKYKIRSLLHPLPGCLLVEADYIGAELYGMAIMSGDPTMIGHAQRNQLSEDDPNYYDIHSNVAVKAFNLECAPTKKGLKSIGKVALRIAAKNVIFGAAYGRGAKAIAMQCKEEGNPITEAQAEQIIAAIFKMYPGLVAFFNEAKRRSREERWLCSCFGAFRRFPYTEDRMMLGEFERQAQNFGIQSMIASCVDRALAHMRHHRNYVLKQPDMFRFALQVHDAVLLHVPYRHVEQVCEEVIPLCMTEKVAIYPTRLDGIPTGGGPYHLGTDIEVHNYWGEHLTTEFAVANGIPLKYAA